MSNEPGSIIGIVYEVPLDYKKQLSTGTSVSLVVDNETISQQFTKKGRYNFPNIDSGTYVLDFSKTGYTKKTRFIPLTIPNTTVVDGQRVEVDDVNMIEEVKSFMSIPPVIIGGILVGMVAATGITDNDAKTVISDTIVSEKSSMLKKVEEVEARIPPGEEDTINKVKSMVAGKLLEEGKTVTVIAEEYKKTINELIIKRESSTGSAKRAYSTIIKTATESMVIDIGSTKVSNLSAKTMEDVKETVTNLKNANINIETIKKSLETNKFNTRLKIPSISKMSGVFK